MCGGVVGGRVVVGGVVRLVVVAAALLVVGEGTGRPPPRSLVGAAVAKVVPAAVVGLDRVVRPAAVRVPVGPATDCWSPARAESAVDDAGTVPPASGGRRCPTTIVSITSATEISTTEPAATISAIRRRTRAPARATTASSRSSGGSGVTPSSASASSRNHMPSLIVPPGLLPSPAVTGSPSAGAPAVLLALS